MWGKSRAHRNVWILISEIHGPSKCGHPIFVGCDTEMLFGRWAVASIPGLSWASNVDGKTSKCRKRAWPISLLPHQHETAGDNGEGGRRPSRAVEDPPPRRFLTRRPLCALSSLPLREAFRSKKENLVVYYEEQRLGLDWKQRFLARRTRESGEAQDVYPEGVDNIRADLIFFFFYPFFGSYAWVIWVDFWGAQTWRTAAFGLYGFTQFTKSGFL